MQELIIADSTTAKKCTIWEDVNTLQEGLSYRLCNFMVREYNAKKVISKPRDGATIVEIEEIGAVIDDVETNGEELLENVQIVGVAQLLKYRSCMRCKARVEPCNAPFG